MFKNHNKYIYINLFIMQTGCEIPHANSLEDISYCNTYEESRERIIICKDTHNFNFELTNLYYDHTYQIWFLDSQIHSAQEMNGIMLDISGQTITDGNLSYFQFTTLGKDKAYLTIDNGDINISITVY